jgi:molybdate transport system ATP-binding protein
MATQLIVEVDKTFHSGTRVDAKISVDLDQEPVQVLFGPSGSGKSTFLRSIAGLEIPERGLVRFGNETWLDTEKSIFVSPQARRVSYLSQKPALFPHLNVLSNITYGLGALAPSVALSRAHELIELLEIRGLENRLPRELSGGQQQRVALARALSVRPRLVLLDEPFSAVDQPLKYSLRIKFRELFRALSIPALIVTHDLAEASSLGHRTHLIDQGKLLQSELSGEIFRKPNSLRAAEILGFENFIQGENSIDAIRADEILLSDMAGMPVQVQESISEGAVIRILLQCEDGRILTSIQPHSRFPSSLPIPGDRFRATLPENPVRFLS